MIGGDPVELNWQVNGLSLAGLSWGKPGAKPLLALHGWLDNAASFSYLAPLLDDYHVVALDLTGHGLSARRSADSSYQIWDDLPEIEGVADVLGWDSFCLIGHSRGAIISCLLASALPQRVEALVLLDALAPAPLAEEEFPAQLRKFLHDKRAWQSRDNRVFHSLEAAAASRAERGLPATAAQLLIRRNLQHCEGGLRWTPDPRLRGASAVKLTAGQIAAVLSALTMPALLILAQDGFARRAEVIELAEKFVNTLEVEVLPGGHHFHMEAGVDLLAQRIADFLTASETAGDT